jgi:hypothetical protein
LRLKISNTKYLYLRFNPLKTKRICFI